ncbi:unnamed protein product [Psylliodes chrysocephalus]|uniref:Uncharacterized protein n=1 Tax=Psylliodes chrysocephalus TaxID=3402493 RepID=A0A9P0CET9_9CUCU|nr:unnamed protein product [Psylliodes chrysocephala]
MDIITIINLTQRCIGLLRTCLRTFSAERPATTLAVVISVCVAVLPFVTVTALMPLTILLDLSNALATKGVVYVIYSLIFQVSILAVIVFILFIVAFAIVSSATIIHKYNIFIK